jgi:ribosomal protein S18 acetylase RimI-like enzyme
MGPNGRGHRGPDDGSRRAQGQSVDPSGAEGRPSPATITLRLGTVRDAGWVAALHASQISEGFLSFLGPRFLEHLYRRIALFEHSFLLVAQSEGGPAGFIAGSTDVSGLYRSFLWHDGVKAALGVAGRLLAGWRRVIETLRHGSAGGTGVGRGAELLAVAVDSSQQGRGEGRQLVGAFLDEVGNRGLKAAHVVVGADNAGAVSLYERAGFVTVDRFELHPGTESLLMQWDNRPAPQEDPG